LVTEPAFNDFNLDAYGHLSWGVGYNDEYDPEPIPAMVVVAKAAAEDLDEEQIEQLSLFPRNCGDWTAWVDADRIGDWVGYHVVIDSDAGGMTDTIESGVMSLKDARRELPFLLDGYRDTASEYLVAKGTWFTPSEVADDLRTIQRWKDHLNDLLA
jgi:hypothetical protein